MRRAYYYLAASLPLLHFDGKPPFGYKKFLDDCRRQLSEKDFALVAEATLDHDGEPDGRNAMFDAWLRFQRGLRNELAWIRAEELNKDPYDHLRGDRHVEARIVDVIAEASRSDNPLVAEKALDEAKWRQLEDLVRGHYFDVEFLITYSLKLQILERYQRIDSPEGAQRLEQYRRETREEIEHILSEL